MKQKILVVEDEQELLAVIASVLRGYGCDVTCARSANEARLHLSRETYHDLLTDVNLPDMNGIDFVRSLPHRPEKVWIMSGHLEASDPRLQAMAGFLPKPFRAQSLKKLVRSIG